MKVYIGPYDHWFQPYRWAKKLLQKWYGDDERGSLYTYDKVSAIARRRFKWLLLLESWVNNWYTPAVKVRVDYYDTWGVDRTLAPIVLPLLKQLKATKHGSPHVDDEDVPEELKSTSAPPMTEEEMNTGRVDANWFKRWDWVMDEMIWAFEQLNNPEADSQFHTDIDPAKPRFEDGLSFEESMKRGKFDKDGYIKWQERKTRGLTFFGKYFEALWD